MLTERATPFCMAHWISGLGLSPEVWSGSIQGESPCQMVLPALADQQHHFLVVKQVNATLAYKVMDIQSSAFVRAGSILKEEFQRKSKSTPSTRYYPPMAFLPTVTGEGRYILLFLATTGRPNPRISLNLPLLSTVPA